MIDDNAYQSPERQDESYERSEKEGDGPRYHVLGCMAVGLFLILVWGCWLNFCPNDSEAPPQTHCMNNIRQLALAMVSCSSGRLRFPPAYIADENGKPMHSWRVLLLPELDQQALFDEYSMDEPWDGPNNSKLHEKIAAVYRCPKSDGRRDATNYCLVTGPGTAFVGDETINFANIADGLSNSILLVEVNSNRIGACEPKDLTIDEAIREIRDGGADGTHHHPGGCVVARMDGATLFVDAEVDAETLRGAMLIADGKTSDFD